MVPGQEANRIFFFLHNNCMLSVLIRLASVHTIYNFMIRKFPKLFVFLSYWKNFVGTQKRVRISHGKRAISVRAIGVQL